MPSGDPSDNDTRHAMPFGDLFPSRSGARTTPQDLLEAGIYSEIAVPLKSGSGFRKVSMWLLAIALCDAGPGQGDADSEKACGHGDVDNKSDSAKMENRDVGKGSHEGSYDGERQPTKRTTKSKMTPLWMLSTVHRSTRQMALHDPGGVVATGMAEAARATKAAICMQASVRGLCARLRKRRAAAEEEAEAKLEDDAKLVAKRKRRAAAEEEAEAKLEDDAKLVAKRIVSAAVATVATAAAVAAAAAVATTAAAEQTGAAAEEKETSLASVRRTTSGSVRSLVALFSAKLRLRFRPGA